MLNYSLKENIFGKFIINKHRNIYLKATLIYSNFLINMPWL